MIRFIIRRSLYSVLVLVGVLLLTFLLFEVAAGDPVAAVLGKGATPEDIDSLRKDLGANLPLFYGERCITESFSNYKKNSPLRYGVSKLNNKIVIKRNFKSNNIRAEITINNKVIKQKIADNSEIFTFGGNPSSIEFYKIQDTPFNSRFLRSIQEVVSFKSTFPYVAFFNFGKTITTKEDIRKILCRGVVPSLSLMVPIFFGELIFGILFALLATAFKDRWIDRTLVVCSVATMSISYLVLIVFGQWIFGYYLNLFPVWGYESWIFLLLPILIGIISGIGSNVRFYRSVFVNELNREYLRTAKAKGCSPIKIFGNHLLRNAGIQIVTRASASIPFLFTGSLLLESFFGIPGLGFIGIDALYNSDIQLLKALVIVSAILFISVNLIADLVYGLVDPRISLK